MQNVQQILLSDPLVKLVQKENFVGWIYSIDYDSAFIMTNDLWKAEALGIPHNCFLVASSFNPDDFAKVAESDREVLLLRVIGLNLRGASRLEGPNIPIVSVSLTRVCAGRLPWDSSCIRNARIGSISSRRRRGDAGRLKLFCHNSLNRGLSNEGNFTSKSAIESTKTPYNSCVQ